MKELSSLLAPVTKSNILIRVSYDGTRYLGWQKTAAGATIQGTLENVLQIALQEPIQVEAASRTDAGVHALAQAANFFTTRPVKDLEKLRLNLNKLLPKDIAITEIAQVPTNFHPTLDNLGKLYGYYICHSPIQMPIHRNFSWHYPYPLDLSNMKKAALHFLGEKDFSALLSQKNEHFYKDCVRDIWAIDVVQLENERVVIYVKGRSFLYKMVRTLVGTLVYVGCGKITPDAIPEILLSGERARAGITAPPHGLFLKEVCY